MKDSQKRALLRELDNLFTKFEKSKVEDKDSKPKTYKHGNLISIGRGYWELALSVVEQQNDKRHIVR